MTDSWDTADGFNNYFSIVFTGDNTALSANPIAGKVYIFLDSFTFNVVYVHNEMIRLNYRCSTVPQ